MKNNLRKPLYFVLVFILIFCIVEITTGFFKSKIALVSLPDSNIILKVRAFPEDISLLCPDGASPIIFEICAYDLNHDPFPFLLINVELENLQGRLEPAYPITNKDGICVVYVYPNSTYITDGAENNFVEASINFYAKKSFSANYQVRLTYPPVLLVHGFQDTSESFVPLKQYLESNGFVVYTIDYPTETDMDTMSRALNDTISLIKATLKEEGIHTNKIDIVAHSLGGLVARYYTSEQSYIEKQDVRKLIFINVPHHGTPWAEAGAKMLDSPFLDQLHPTSSLFSTTFPNSINKGLNHNVQVANIALDNDEVVPLPSALLNSWNIETKVYRIGAEPLSIESILESQFNGKTRHRQLLFYKPVFEDILFSLTKELTYPQKKSKSY